MASPYNYPNGIDGTGPTIADLTGVYLSGQLIYLDTVLGNNANTGYEPELPVATLAQAYTNAAAGDVIVIAAGSAESLSGVQTLGKAGVRVVGLGTGSTRPRYTCTGAVVMFDVTAAGVKIENLYFPASTAAATARISTAAAQTEIKDCYFECGASDTNRAVRVAASGNNARVEGCSFVTVASRPAIGLEVSGAVTDTALKNLTFDGGSFGWTDYALKISAAATRIELNTVALNNRSDFGITVTATSYQLFGLTGSGRVVITA